MRNCEWYVAENTVCGAPASKLMSRPPTEAEEKMDRQPNGVSFVAVVACPVCDAHVEEARLQFGFESSI